jgi:tetratricopeptide (TPR) repeat protein/nitrate/TMAO reductase-like tetraheme cytochrome c subunit
MPGRSTIKAITSIIFFIFSGILILERCKPKEENTPSQQTAKNEFTGDQACKSCHNTEYNDWLQSHHYKAMLPANDSTVEGDFNNSTFTADGVTSRFFKKDGNFFINTQGEDGKNHDYEIKFTFGFTPLQQYLVEFPGGRMQTTRVSWDTKQKKWFHQFPNQKIKTSDWLHWTGNAQNWNTMCASCHSTNLQKNYNIDEDNYNTTYSVLNVSCESCHGPGKLHLDFVNSDDYKKGEKIPGTYLQLNKGAAQLAQINRCAPCHARKSDISASLIQSDEIMDNYIPEIPTTEHFHADGQVNDEDYIYTSFLQSKMFRRDVKCSNCHNPHSGKILFAANQLCLQCHAKTYDDPSHTFHPAGITASECKSCHMPGKIYMGNDLRHDHGFRVPRPDLTVKYGTPNACGGCHNNKPAQWLADAVVKWYGPDRKYHFADDLVPGSKQDQQSEAHLVKLLGDTSVPEIVKAAAASYLGGIPTQKSIAALLNCLSEKDAQVRYRALRSLSNFPAANWEAYVGPLLSDKVRAVRIAAADLFITIPNQQLPAQYADAFNSARRELQNYLAYQADFSVGNVMLADHYLRLQDYYNAEKFYLRGLKKDSLMNYARLNLSTVYNSQGKNDQALKVLEDAAKIDKTNDRIFYNLGLLYYEMKNIPSAEIFFSKAVALKSGNPRVYYNYGLLLSENKKFKEAENILLKGITVNPNDPALYYALTHVYISSNDPVKAKQTGIKLKQLDPVNPEYLQLFRNLGL